MKHFCQKVIIYALSLLLGIGCYQPATGQMAYLQKVTIPLDRDIDEAYKVVPLAEKGVLLLKFQDKTERMAKNKRTKGRPIWVSKLDTNLTNQWANKYIVPFNYFSKQVLQYYYDEVDFKFYLLVVAENLRNFIVFKLNLDNGIMESYEGKSSVNLDIKEFKVLNETMFAYGTLNYRSVAFSFNFIEKIVRFIPSFYAKNQDILAMHTASEQNMVYFIVFDNKKYYLSIKPFSVVLGMGKELTLKDKYDYTLKNAWVYAQSPNQKIVLGTYNLGGADFTQGIYTLQVKDNQQEKLTYYSFADLKCFFDHYKPAKVARIKNRIQKKKQKGKNIYLSYNIFMHPKVFTWQDQWIFSFENYYANYKTTNYTSLRGYAGLGQVFDGFIKRYAAVVAINKEGKITWDNIIKIDEAKQSQLAPTLQLGIYQDSLIMSYIKEDKLYCKIVHQYKTLQEEKMQNLQDIFVQERKDTFENNELSTWYKNYFLIWGTQEKKLPPNLSTELNKSFFYISKLRYKPISEQEKNTPSK